MNRRNFLRNLSGAGVAATLPAWFNRAFAAAPCDQEGTAIVAGAFRRATRAGKPLLVLVIPRSRALRWQQGTQLGAFLNCASTEQLAPIALAEVVCATMADLGRVVPHRISGEPLMVLVETDRVPARAEAVAIEALERTGGRDRALWSEVNAAIGRDVERIAAGLREALVGTVELRSRRADQAAMRLSPRQLDALRSGPIEDLSPDDVERGAALVWSRAPSDVGRVEALATAAIARLRLRRVPGSHWASSIGCGLDIEELEDDDRMMIGCGMGRVPEKERRFLYFFNKYPSYGEGDEEAEPE